MSSFKRRTPASQPAPPTGTRLSAYNSQLLTSSGVSSLDDILASDACGGLPVGTLLIVREDQQTRYAQLLLRYFLAQGMAHGHGMLVASADEAPDALLRRLPGWTDVTTEPKQESGTPAAVPADSEADRMKIAWRYQKLKRVDGGSTDMGQGASSAATFCHRFDLTKTVREEQLAAASVCCVPMDYLAQYNGAEHGKPADPYAHLYAEIAKQVDGEYSAVAKPVTGDAPRRILRIAIQSLASPSWPAASPQATFQFLHSLRGLLRYSLAVAMITLPAYLYESVAATSQSAAWLRRLEHCADLVLELRSFTDEERAAMGATDSATGYHGTLQIRRAAGVNTLLSTSVKYGHPAENLAFRQRRHGLMVETFHLPPEGGVTERRSAPAAGSGSASRANPSAKLGCGGGGGGVDPLAF
ncbi:Elongator complex protein 4 [Thamnocephalis sphaerospora]|uniref:Elongator complex protein 4 n=1 Tax=Thamnocephalis sphaerospora TaxID=78915 RepID=A0A4P9XXK8_9FUNG|nr:Elongator complex protein 4 [Thamnocephalis sphaerospora]|eukprot:RKP11054.1 Elongator complex protein 4 [Thamnocephalis sphaerospora]